LIDIIEHNEAYFKLNGNKTNKKGLSVMILLNMFGVDVEILPSTTIHSVPLSFDSDEDDDEESTDKTIKVIVESICFVVTREMLEQRADRALSSNIFAGYLHFHTDHGHKIGILPSPDVPHGKILGKETYYPLIFDFLRCRLETSLSHCCTVSVR
jgi:hypothetical protein